MKRAMILGALGTFLLITNRWLSLEEWVTVMKATDVLSYLAIAYSAPSFPSHQHIYLHHAQRFPIPYLLGLVASICGHRYETVFTLAALLCCILIVLVVHRILSHFRLNLGAYSLCVSLLILNPFVFRYYLVVPGMLIDLVFVLGLSAMIEGLLKRKFAQVLGAVLVATIARQTALLLMPGLSLWISLGSGWRDRPFRLKILYIATLVACTIAAFEITRLIASGFASEDVSILDIRGGYDWLRESPSLWLFLKFLGWGAMPLVFPLSILAGLRYGEGVRPSGAEVWSCIVFIAAMVAQPIIAGPALVFNNVFRLNALAFVPLVVILANALREAKGFVHPTRVALILLICLPAAASFHPEFSLIATDYRHLRLYAAIYFGLAIAAGIVTYLLGRTSDIKAEGTK